MKVTSSGPRGPLTWARGSHRARRGALVRAVQRLSPYSVHQAALRALEAWHVLDLSRRDQHVFVKAILSPSAPNARLRTAWSRQTPAAARARVATAGRKSRRGGRG